MCYRSDVRAERVKVPPALSVKAQSAAGVHVMEGQLPRRLTVKRLQTHGNVHSDHNISRLDFLFSAMQVKLLVAVTLMMTWLWIWRKEAEENQSEW